MNTTASPDNRTRLDVVNTCEREFLVVWKALNLIRSSIPFGELMRLEVERAADTLLHLMRASECIDPTVCLDGSGSLGPGSTHADL